MRIFYFCSKLFFIIVNWISTGFGLLSKPNRNTLLCPFNPSSFTYPIQSHMGDSSLSQVPQDKMQARPRTGHQSVVGLTQTDRQQFALTFSPTVNLEWPVGLKVVNWFKNGLLRIASDSYMEQSRSAAALVQVWPVALFCVSSPSHHCPVYLHH